MTIAQQMLAEFEMQAPVTRRYLERLPEDKYGWKPHPRSLTAGQLTYHLAFVPGGVVRAAKINPAPVPNITFPEIANRAELLKMFDASVATVRELLPTFDDAAMAETWALVANGKVELAVPRGAFLRDVMLSHWYQHRGQFSVYLRMLDVPVPASWGPSADEPPLHLQRAHAAA